MTAILFGSISTVADTSELQRQAFNDAFEQHGLDWRWEQDEYRELLQGSGGEQRIAEYARERGTDVDAGAVHRTKSELFQQRLAEAKPAPRAGVAETVSEAREQGLKVALVTTTAPENVEALVSALDPQLSRGDFDLVLDRTDVQDGKPDAAVYALALEKLGEQPQDCVAIEDNLGGVQSAKAAGIACVAFPNQNTAGHDFSSADEQTDGLTLSALRGHVAA